MISINKAFALFYISHTETTPFSITYTLIIAQENGPVKSTERKCGRGGGAPATGDAGVALYAACGLLAAGAVSVLVLRRKREN